MRSISQSVHAAACAVTVLAAVTTAQAGAITFDLDGAGGANAPIVVGALDMAPGNMLLTQPATDKFIFAHQASLVGLINDNGLPVASPGLNSTFEVTIVSRVEFTRTLVSPISYAVNPSAVQPVNTFIEIWYDTTPDANPLAGTGYNDGARIYLGAPTGALPGLVSQEIFDGPEVAYDQFGVDNYPGETTLISTGSYVFGSTTTLQDNSFFLTPVSSVELTSGIDTPFDMTNPSANHVAAPNGAAPVPGSFVIGLPFQADGALQFTAVPEPGSVAALGVGAIILLARRRAMP